MTVKDFQIRPLLGFGQAVQLIESETAADFDPAVILLHGFGGRVRVRLDDLELGEEITDRIGQLWLVVFDRQHIVRLPVADSLNVLAWVPMASIVKTMQPSNAKVANSSGMAVFSFDFAGGAVPERVQRARPHQM